MTSDTKIAASFRVSPTALRRRDRVSRFGSSGQSLWGASQGRERNVVLGLAHGRSRFAPRSGAGAGSRDREVRRVGDQPIPRRDKVYHSSCRQDGRPHDRLTLRRRRENGIVPASGGTKQWVPIW